MNAASTLLDFEAQLRKFADVIVRVGLNLQRWQRLLITEPYELQGVARSAEVIVNAVKTVAAGRTEIIWGDHARLRQIAAKRDWYAFAELTAANARVMENYIKNGDALLFLVGSQPRLFEGVAVENVAELRRIAAENFGPISHLLNRAATNWTAAPAPSPIWAHAVYEDLPTEQRLAALWNDVFAALRVNATDPLAEWSTHLAELNRLKNSLNETRLKFVRYQGEGTDLTVELPADHLWCTAHLRTRFGHTFVANLPTEELFTAPDKDTASGKLRVTRPLHFAGSVIDGIELEFAHGRIVNSRARTGGELLKKLLATDEGALRLGEIALVPSPHRELSQARTFHHILMDENLSNHVALGEAYCLCSQTPDSSALNRSAVHFDLPLDARLTWQ